MFIRRSISGSALSCMLAVWLLSPAVQAASLQVTLTDQQNQPVDDAVVYIKTVDAKAPATTPRQVDVDQVDEMFVPHVRAITVGSTVNFPNSDHIRHHVYSFSETKPFELPLYIGVPAEPVTFDKPGLVTLGCNIHDHMLGYILVLETPYFAESQNGMATLEQLPAGEMMVEIWHPRLNGGSVVQRTLNLADADAAQLSVALDLRPERALRRAPRRGGSRY